MGFCTNCGRQVRGDMTFCPGCGADLSANETEGARPRRGVEPSPSNMPGPGQYPTVPYGFPTVYFRPPMTGRRMLTLAGAVILIIDASLATLLGIVLTMMAWEFGAGVLMLSAGIFAIISAVGIFMSFNPFINIMGPVALIFSGILLWVWEWDAFIVSIIGISIAFVSLFLIGLGWSDMVARHQTRTMGIHPSMAGLPPGMAGAPPPAYGGAEPPSMLNLRK